jgi:hypothetical protein
LDGDDALLVEPDALEDERKEPRLAAGSFLRSQKIEKDLEDLVGLGRGWGGHWRLA